MQDNYFIFNLYGDNWGDLKEKGKYVFQNIDCKVGVHNVLPFLVFHYVTDYNLEDLELFFRLAGFSAFTREEMPDSVTSPDVINLSNRKNAHAGNFGGFRDEYSALKYIEQELGAGIIRKFLNVKKMLLAHEKLELHIRLKSIDDVERKLNNSEFDNNTYNR
ncbi:MAG: hypothetical protein E7163_04350 [Firmicutes bacterium]|nr:hypothetical protein [Bacillota bacterium]